MNLQQLIAELQALALAYPDATPVRLRVSSHEEEIASVLSISTPDGLVIAIADAANSGA